MEITRRNPELPMQFNFAQFWLTRWLTLRNEPQIVDALSALTESYRDLADAVYEDERQHDEEQAILERDLRYHVAEVKVRDYHWLRCEMEENDLNILSEAIAATLFPDKEWIALESRDAEYHIVTDPERSMVFDFKRSHFFQGGSSLALVGDKKYRPTDLQVEQALAFQNQALSRETEFLTQLRETVKNADRPNNVSEIRPHQDT